MGFANFWDSFKKIFTGTIERPSPSDIVPAMSINILPGSKVQIDLANINIPLDFPPVVWIPSIPDTNSMDGAFDYGHNNILIAGSTEQDQKRIVDFIKVGDVAVYKIPGTIYAIHRVIAIGSDAEGKWFKFKGDNNAVADPNVARAFHITHISIGTIY